MQSEWKDIESAPRDGTTVLIAYRLKFDPARGVFVNETCWHGDGYWFQHDEADVFEAIAWMPMPTYPLVASSHTERAG